MPKRLRSIKVDDADYDIWRQKAAEAGVSTSEWIRERCNEALRREAIGRIIRQQERG
jgi:hypothetical protein